MANAIFTPSFPPRINIETTNHCNIKCVMCPNHIMTREKAFMGLGTYKKLIDECAVYDVKIWLHLIGEPLLNPDIIKMIQYAKGKKIKDIGLSTNGTLLEESAAENILNSGLTRLECSIDSINQENYKKIRGSNDYNKVVDNIRRLLLLKKEMKKKAPIISIQFVNMQINKKEIKEFSDFWKESLNEEDFIMTIECSSFAGQIKNKIASIKANNNKVIERKPCDWLWKGAVVLANGDVTICAADYDGKFVLGNIKNQSLQSIWLGEKYKYLRKSHSVGEYSAAGLCQDCEDWVHEDGTRYKNILRNG